MAVVGVPYVAKGPLDVDEPSGDGSRWPSETELAVARCQGRHVTKIAKKLVGD